MKENKPYAVVVDGYSAGAMLPLEFRKYNYHSIHVQSNTCIATKVLSQRQPKEWHDHYTYLGNLEDLATSLAEQFQPELIVAGCHSGIWLADALREFLGLPCYGERNRRIYLDKHAMVVRLEKKGIATPTTLAAENVPQAIQEARKLGGWPLVVKPINGTAGHGVTFCYNENQLTQAAKVVLNNKDFLGYYQDKLLIQEKLTGVLYSTYTISLQGKHFLIAASKADMRYANTDKNTLVYDRYCLISPQNHQHWQLLQNYVQDYLTGLNFDFGAGSGEVMLTAEGPKLIEFNPRVTGSGMGTTREVKQILGYHHLSAYVESLCHPSHFISRFTTSPPVLNYHVWFVAIVSFDEGYVNSLDKLEAIETLSSFSSYLWKPKLGDYLVPCTDQLTIAVFVVLKHRNQYVLQADYEVIRNMEKQDIFCLETVLKPL